MLLIRNQNGGVGVATACLNGSPDRAARAFATLAGPHDELVGRLIDEMAAGAALNEFVRQQVGFGLQREEISVAQDDGVEPVEVAQRFLAQLFPLGVALLEAEGQR